MPAKISQLSAGGQVGPKSGTQPCLTHSEAERIVSALRPFNVEDVGSAEFLAQHKAISKLNLQAHANVQTHSDEFVTELLVLHNKATLLVRELLVIEAWKAKLLPRLRTHLADDVPGLVTYFILYHEAALANLLELVLYHQEVAEAIEEDALLELVDWCSRQLTDLASGRAGEAVAAAAGLSPEQLLAQTPLQELDARAAEVSWGVGLAALTTTRYLAQHGAQLPLAVLHRLLRSNDFVMALVPLLESPPWVLQGGGKVRKYVDGAWRVVPPSERHQVTQHDAQAWISLTYLVADPAARSKYDLDGHRVDALLRLRKHLHELLLDQLPPLQALVRALDELALGAAQPGAANATSSWLVLEQVPELRQSLLEGRDWDAVAAAQRKAQFGAQGLAASRRCIMDMAQVFDLMCSLQEPTPSSSDSSSQKGTSKDSRLADTCTVADQAEEGDAAQLLRQPVRVDCSRKVQAGLWEHSASFQCSLDTAAEGTPVTVKAPGTTSKSTNGSSSISGMRYKLRPMVDVGSDGENQAGPPVLPPEGKVVVRWGQRRAEALLTLPAPSSAACIQESPAGLWLTVGLLAADGLALQLKLRRHESGKQRDKAAGTWAVYQPVGGALTIADEAANEAARTLA